MSIAPIANGRTIMDFGDAARALGGQITTAEIAVELGVSPDAVRQARLAKGAPGYRTPPRGWKKVLARLARERCKDLQKLADQLETEAAQ